MFTESKTKDDKVELWKNDGSSATTTTEVLFPVFLIITSPKLTNKSGPWVVCICAGFLQKLFFWWKTSIRDKVEVVVPGGDLTCGKNLTVCLY